MALGIAAISQKKFNEIKIQLASIKMQNRTASQFDNLKFKG
jgi:hypothetical protein